MKLFFQVLLLLLCAGCLSSSAEKAANDTEDRNTACPDSIAEEKTGPEREENDPPFVAPESKMPGDWIGFIQNWNMPTKLSGIRYRFLDSGTWEILEEGAGSKAEPQGWYRIIENENKLLLQPHAALLKNDNAAILAILPNEDMFIIPDPLDENIAITFIRENTLTVPTPAFLADRWIITQMDPESNEKRVAKYVLVLKEDCTYAVEQPGRKLPEEWATGTYSISGLRIKLDNDYTGDGLWNAPAFFLLKDKLWFDDSRYCVWCERDNNGNSEKETVGKQPEKPDGD